MNRQEHFRKVRVDMASHSPQVQPLVDDPENCCRMRYNRYLPQLKFSLFCFSREVHGKSWRRIAWTKNLKKYYRSLLETVQNMIQEGYGHFVERSVHIRPCYRLLVKMLKACNCRLPAEYRKGKRCIILFGAIRLSKYFANGGRVSWKNFQRLNFPKNSVTISLAENPDIG